MASATVQSNPINMNEITAIIEANKDSIQNRKANGVVGRYYAGHHRRVFDLIQYPDHIIKVGSIGPGQREMLGAIQKGAAIVKERGLNRCVVPTVQMTMTPVSSIWVEQKLKGVYDALEARDKSEQEFRKMKDDPELHAKWVETFRQAAEFIDASGYFDVDWRNILLMDEGLGFVDFEGVAETPDAANGLQRLLDIAPPEAFDAILAIAKKRGALLFHFCIYDRDFLEKGFTKNTPYKDAVKMAKEIRQEKLQHRTCIVQHHAAKGISNPETPVDGSAYAEGSVERIIIDQFNGSFDTRKHSQSQIEIRKLFWQPFLWDSAFSQGQFESALTRLKNDQVIAAWKVSPAQQLSCYEYNIYF